MDSSEAYKIAVMISGVDGGCGVCVRSAMERLMRDFPDIEWKEILKPIARKKKKYWLEEIDSYTPEE